MKYGTRVRSVGSHKIGVSVEGPSDEKVIKELANKLGVAIEVRVGPYRKYANLLLGDCPKVIILKDLNCNGDPTKLEEEIRQNIGNNARLKINIVIHEIEAWLLADEEAIAYVLGVKKEKVKKIQNPEEIHDPKEVLDNLFKKCKDYKYGYDENRHAKRIAENVKIKSLARCQSFKKFQESLQDC